MAIRGCENRRKPEHHAQLIATQPQTRAAPASMQGVCYTLMQGHDAGAAMAILSISEAARTWRVGRTTIQRAIREGRLSAAIQPNGGKGIDTSELVRVFGEPCIDADRDAGGDAPTPPTTNGSMQVDTEAPSQRDAPQAVVALQAQVRLLETQLAEAHDRELWFRRQLEEVQRLLPAPAPPTPAPPRRVRAWLLLALLLALLLGAGWRWWDAIRATMATLVG